jgi:uncharacterized membrane protein SpoIIM required for sporulation
MRRFDLEGFIRRRRGVWDDLDEALDRHAEDPRGTGRDGCVRLLRLARQTAGDLARARSRTANPELLGRLDALVGRAWRELHAFRPGRGRFRLGDLLLRAIPAAVHARRAALLVATGAFALGAAFGFAAVLVDPDQAARLVPEQFFSASPAERVADIESGPERIGSAAEAAGFTSMLYTHNIQVSMLAAALAATTIWLGVAILAWNGIILGAVAAQYLVDGQGVFFLAWVGPHGALEIPGILLGASAGFVLGRALWLPGAVPRQQALRAAAGDAWNLLLATAIILVGAGFIEGSFSQLSSRSLPYGIKIAAAAALHALLLMWLFGIRLRRRTA